MTTRASRNRKAFSLVELLIAFFVLLVGILAVLVLFPLGLKQSQKMVESSTASFVARNARALMESHPFGYHGGGNAKRGNGTATLVQLMFGPRGVPGAWVPANTWNMPGTPGCPFPVMFPRDVLGSAADTPDTFPPFRKELRVLDPNTGTYDRITYEPNRQFTWDARFSVGRGPGEVPPPGGRPNPNQPSQVIAWTVEDIRYWWVQYYKYYAVQISIYRNYAEMGPWQATVRVLPGTKSGGGAYDADDPNRPLKCEVDFAARPDRELMVGSYIRIRSTRSDWYKVTDTRVEGGRFICRLDRPYAGHGLGTGMVWEQTYNDVIGTNSLIESFTTILGSQLDDTDTTASGVSYP
ncbi:MAG TPA: type II secretion system protein [Planctomycetota bacterium]|nr:type II secretion system protein [Planctomycetota bacterium]